MLSEAKHFWLIPVGNRPQKQSEILCSTQNDILPWLVGPTPWI